jgi:hypothetical protein
MKPLIAGLFLLLFFLKSYPQNNVQVIYNYDASGNALFSAENYLAIPVYLVLNFNYLNYASFSEDLPYIKRINPGSTQLFTIFREPNQPNPNFNIEYKWYHSHPAPETETHFPYLIPAKPGTIVKVTDFNIKGEYKAIGFILEQSDEVFAARKGIVVNISEDFDPAVAASNQNRQNFVHILHDDGTIGEYINFTFKGVDCEIGQKIFPGEKIGKAAASAGSLPVIGFALFHESLNSKNFIYLLVEFSLDKSKTSLLTYGNEYKVVHPEETIAKELSRKEAKSLKQK